MLRSAFSPDFRRRLVVAGAVAVSITVAACSDAATAPKSSPAGARAIAGPSEVVLQIGAQLSVRVVDTANKTLKETSWVNFTTSNDDTISVYDNSAKDADPAVGYVRVTMLKAQTYKACFGMSQHYRRDLNYQSPWQPCKSVTTSSGVVDLGKVYARESPQVTFIIKDQFGLRGGATVNLSVAPNWSLNILDGNPSYDESAGSDGIIKYTIGWPNVVTWCAYNAPSAKHKLLSPKCGTLNAEWGKKFTITLLYEQVIT